MLFANISCRIGLGLVRYHATSPAVFLRIVDLHVTYLLRCAFVVKRERRVSGLSLHSMEKRHLGVYRGVQPFDE